MAVAGGYCEEEGEGWGVWRGGGCHCLFLVGLDVFSDGGGGFFE